MSVVVTAKRGLFLWLLAVTLAVSLPATCAVSRMHPSPPDPPESCRDTAELRSASDGLYRCAPGAHIEIFPSEAKSFRGEATALFKCTCGAFTPDASVSK